jgi:hypothetical protein
MSRMPWEDGDVVKEEMDGLFRALDTLEGPKEKRYAKTWKEAIGKRKG